MITLSFLCPKIRRYRLSKTSPTLTSVLNVMIVNADPRKTIKDTKINLHLSITFWSAFGILYSRIKSLSPIDSICIPGHSFCTCLIIFITENTIFSFLSPLTVYRIISPIRFARQSSSQ